MNMNKNIALGIVKVELSRHYHRERECGKSEGKGKTPWGRG